MFTPMQRTLLIPALILASALVGAVRPAGANALTVAVQGASTHLLFCEEKGGCTSEVDVPLTITDPAGADNDVTIEALGEAAFVPINSLLVTDASGPVSAGAGCEPVAGGGARCTVPVASASVIYTMTKGSVVDLGGGNDTLRLVGDDFFCGEVMGGPGTDTLTGTGVSVFHGINPQCALTWDGGTGADRVTVPVTAVSYAHRAAPVTVTLGDGANDGEAGEGDDVGADVRQVTGGDGDDTLSGAESLDGGPGNDRLTAAAGGSTLLGGAGDDSLVGGAAKDLLDGGGGQDVLTGGGGNDILRWDGGVRASGGLGDDALYLSGGDRQTVDGGPGRDVVYGPSSTKRRPAPAIRISLDGRANDGRPGQHNNVRGVERVVLRRGVVIGSSADEELTVDNGSVFGRGGHDLVTGSLTVDGGSGFDTLTGTGHGAVLRAVDGETDALRCPGRTRFAVVAIIRDRRDSVTNCFVRTAH